MPLGLGGFGVVVVGDVGVVFVVGVVGVVGMVGVVGVVGDVGVVGVVGVVDVVEEPGGHHSDRTRVPAGRFSVEICLPASRSYVFSLPLGSRTVTVHRGVAEAAGRADGPITTAIVAIMQPATRSLLPINTFGVGPPPAARTKTGPPWVLRLGCKLLVDPALCNGEGALHPCVLGCDIAANRRKADEGAPVPYRQVVHMTVTATLRVCAI